jgi:hypothetical protein
MTPSLPLGCAAAESPARQAHIESKMQTIDYQVHNFVVEGARDGAGTEPCGGVRPCTSTDRIHTCRISFFEPGLLDIVPA